MGLMNEYIAKKWNNKQFEDELVRLIKKYNKIQNSYLLIYTSAVEKPIQERMISFEDSYLLADLLRDKKDQKTIDVYIETLGGIGEAAENFVKYLRNNFETVSFIVSGQAKSAGTIIALSGDEIYMTETGSLGPIDAQIKLGRSIDSSSDYIEWVEQKQKESEETKKLNPFDATMIAQITPGELNGVFNTHKYAQDLVIEWLVKYKFKNWNQTETNKKPVTPEMKQERAEEIAAELSNRSRWRTHARSLDIEDLLSLGLKINRVEDKPKIADIIFRIQTVIKFLFDLTPSIKILATAENKIFKRAISPKPPISLPEKISLPQKADSLEVDANCNHCRHITKFYVMFTKDKVKERELKKKGRIPFPKNSKYKCKCGMDINLSLVRNEIEKKLGRKIF